MSDWTRSVTSLLLSPAFATAYTAAWSFNSGNGRDPPCRSRDARRYHPACRVDDAGIHGGDDPPVHHPLWRSQQRQRLEIRPASEA